MYTNISYNYNYLDVHLPLSASTGTRTRRPHPTPTAHCRCAASPQCRHCIRASSITRLGGTEARRLECADGVRQAAATAAGVECEAFNSTAFNSFSRPYVGLQLHQHQRAAETANFSLHGSPAAVDVGCGLLRRAAAESVRAGGAAAEERNDSEEGRGQRGMDEALAGDGPYWM